MATIRTAITVIDHQLVRWLGVVPLAGALALLAGCGATSVPAGSTSPSVTGLSTTVSPSPDPAGASGVCGKAVVGGAAGVPMPARAAGCLTSALHTCRAARLVIVEQGVDVLRTDTLSVTTGESPCAVTVAETLEVVPRPATATTFTCRRATLTQGALVLTDCSDATSHTFPSQG